MEPHEIGAAFEELKKEVASSRMDPEKVERLNVVLDGWETKSAEVTAANSEITKQSLELKSLTEELEKKGVENGEINKRVDELEATFARNKNAGLPPEAFSTTEEYKAMTDWCREGTEGISMEQKALLRTDSAVDGGVLTTSEMDPVITKKITEIDPFRSVARIRTISNKSMEMSIRSTIPTATYEGETGSAAESASTYENVTVTPYRQTFQTPITKDMLMDSVFNMEAEITLDSSEAFGFGEGNGFIVGNGVKQPVGIVQDATLQADALAGDTSALVSVSDMIKLTGELKTGYNPVYVLNRRVLASLRGKREDAITAGDEQGAFLWQPGMNGATPNTINGFPYIIANSMPDEAANAYAVAFGDFARGYTIIDRTGFSIIRDEFTRAGDGIVIFTMARWNTGIIVLHEAIKLLKCAA